MTDGTGCYKTIVPVPVNSKQQGPFDDKESGDSYVASLQKETISTF